MTRSGTTWIWTTAALTVICCVAMVAPQIARADGTYQMLLFVQDWTNVGQITANDDWSGVPGIIGYRGDGLSGSAGADPQTILVDGTTTPVDVIANQSSPSALTTGGVAEFDGITNRVVALQGSTTARAPFLLIHVNTTGVPSIRFRCNLRDIDGSADNAVQPIAVHYRVGHTGDFTNLREAFVADASTGPSMATLVSLVDVTLPPAAGNQSEVQIRVMTADAVGSDEWIGVDDITIEACPTISVQPSNTSACVGGSASFSVTASGAAVVYQWRRGTTNLTNGGNISGATSATLTLNPVGPGDAGTDYNCIVSSICLPMTTGNASLTVFASGGSGDGDASGVTNGGDIHAFVQFLGAGGGPSASYCTYDIDHDGDVDLNDLPLFVDLLLLP